MDVQRLTPQGRETASAASLLRRKIGAQRGSRTPRADQLVDGLAGLEGGVQADEGVRPEPAAA